MGIFSKVAGVGPRVCGIEISSAGQSIPSNIVGYQPFYNSLFIDASFESVYHGLTTVSFSEESARIIAGIYWKQKLTFKFPSTDKDRSERIEKLLNVKFVKIKLTNGLHISLGRNDVQQNKKPDVKVESNERMTTIEISFQSIYPSGFTPNFRAYQLPAFIPLTLI